MPEDLAVNAGGDTGVATFNIRKEGTVLRRTFVFQNRGGRRLSVHFHASKTSIFRDRCSLFSGEVDDSPRITRFQPSIGVGPEKPVWIWRNRHVSGRTGVAPLEPAHLPGNRGGTRLDGEVAAPDGGISPYPRRFLRSRRGFAGYTPWSGETGASRGKAWRCEAGQRGFPGRRRSLFLSGTISPGYGAVSREPRRCAEKPACFAARCGGARLSTDISRDTTRFLPVCDDFPGDGGLWSPANTFL